MSELVASQVIGAVKKRASLTADADFEARRLAARERLLRLGMTARSWAIANGYPQGVVYKVLSGSLQGRHGKAHEIAVRLGLKDGEIPGHD